MITAKQLRYLRRKAFNSQYKIDENLVKATKKSPHYECPTLNWKRTFYLHLRR